MLFNYSDYDDPTLPDTEHRDSDNEIGRHCPEIELKYITKLVFFYYSFAIPQLGLMMLLSSYMTNRVSAKKKIL